MASLADVRKCAEDLKTKSSSQKNKSVVTVAEQMRSNLTLLELSSPSSKSLEKLCLLFRKPLVPLYKLFTAQTCRFASTLFIFIHEEKVSKCEERSVILAWEKVLGSILSGVADYLEDEFVVTASSKTTVSNSFYAPLCRIYFSATPPKTETNIDLSCIIYLLLCKTIDHHQENQRALRKNHLRGGKLLGVALSRSRAFLAIEALIELLASLMPASKGADEFLDNVFDPELFPKHRELKALLVAAPKGVWEEISCQVYQVLAAMDVLYPQPFKIVMSTVTDQSCSPAEFLYVDEKGLTSNIIEEGGLETFQVPYHIIEKIKYSSSSEYTTFTFKLNSLPDVGKGITDKKQEVTWILEIERQDFVAFLKAFKARKLTNLIDRSERKLSIIDDELSLEFPPSSLSMKEKARQFCNFPPEVVPGVSPGAAAKSSLEDTGSTEDMSSVPVDAISSSPSKNSRDERMLATTSSSPHTTYNEPSKGVKDTKRTSSQSLPSPSPKRKRAEISDNMEPSSKRRRDELPSEHRISTASPVFVKSPKTTKRYGKKPRTSSPTPGAEVGLELSDPEEVSEPRTNAKPPKTRAVDPKAVKGGKAAAMRAKGGKKVTTVVSPKRPLKKEQPKPLGITKKANAREKEPLPSKPKEISVHVSDTAPELVLAVEAGDETPSKPRRSARVKEQDKPKVVYKEQSSSQSDDEVVKITKTSNPGTVKAKGEIVLVEFDEPEDQKQSASFGSSTSDANGESFYQDFEIPLKMETSEQSSDLVFNKATDNEKTMIDLTLDDSPPPKPTSYKPSSRPQPVKLSAQRVDQVEPGKSRKKLEVITIDDDEDVANEEPMQKFPWTTPQKAKSPPPKTTNPLLPLHARHQRFKESSLTLAKPVQLTEVPGKLKPVPNVKFTSKRNASKPDAKPVTQFPVVFTPASPVARAVPASAPSPSPEPRMVKEEPNDSLLELQAPDQTAFELVSFAHDLAVAPTFTSSPKPVKKEHTESTILPPIMTKRLQDVVNPTKDSFAPRRERLSGTSALGTDETTRPSMIRRINAEHESQGTAKQPTADNTITNTDQPRSLHRIAIPEPTTVFDAAGPSLKKKPAYVELAAPTSTPVKRSFALQEQRGRVQSTSDEQLQESPYYGKRDKQITDIVEVLNGIQQVLVGKVTHRITSVKTEVRVGRDNILREAAAELEQMRIESAECFNALLDLNNEYATYNREVRDRLDDVLDVNVSIGKKLKETVEDHGRNTVLKRFPKVLPTLPASLLGGFTL
ncbi:hypothetical protein PQX77_016481 [Marasmius sp. AFHP31]|nr:hypothetical protein PQX77_016481 [Marasmius sp. AFHP31]